MRIYQLSIDKELRLIAEIENSLFDLTSARPAITNLSDVMDASQESSTSLQVFVEELIGAEKPLTYTIEDILNQHSSLTSHILIKPPLKPAEVWCAGVTYLRSMEERKEESDTPDVYSRVYKADRPEIFLKDSGHRTVGPSDSIGIRGDAKWNVPEPELAFVVYGGLIAGFTIGNDVSSRDIEGINPLYLAQAKVYDRSCSIGPCFVPLDTIENPQLLEINMMIKRDGIVVFEGQTNTSKMVRTCQELCDWLNRHNPVPDGTVLLTGTGIVPPQGFTLLEGDSVSISIESIGVLSNDVIVV